GAQAIAHILPRMVSLTSLNVTDNNIGEKGGQALSNALVGCNRIIKLETKLNSLPFGVAKGIHSTLTAHRAEARVTEVEELKAEVEDLTDSISTLPQLEEALYTA
ncbi:hypothetical protein KIPB_012618, partial [Kipferlia bialata]